MFWSFIQIKVHSICIYWIYFILQSVEHNVKREQSGYLYDNASMERHHNTLKAEEIYIHSYNNGAYTWWCNMWDIWFGITRSVRTHTTDIYEYLTPAEKQFG